MAEETLQEQSIKQKKIAFAQSEHIEAVIQILKECTVQEKLVGDNEFETLKNAITLDANSTTITNFINLIDHIKKGGLHQPQ